jgi:hypothetical protein
MSNDSIICVHAARRDRAKCYRVRRFAENHLTLIRTMWHVFSPSCSLQFQLETTDDAGCVDRGAAGAGHGLELTDPSSVQNQTCLIYMRDMALSRQIHFELICPCIRNMNYQVRDMAKPGFVANICGIRKDKGPHQSCAHTLTAAAF